ncbi:thiamine transporter 2-like [Diadema antillarum]|uniref:thiamine transporter 2-like n=1 Tax=Diadema antillarum TaxID=105358 RepID=UPI003A892D61
MKPAREWSWVYPTVLLCCYGILKELRPSEPFLTPFLRGFKNLTEEQVDNEVYPVWTYSYMVALVFVFLLTDLLRYKPVINFEGVAYMATWALLIWAFGVEMMKLMQFMYALATSTEIAYYSYIFAAVSTDHYQQVSSYTRASLLTGRLAAGVLGQILISLKVTTYAGLNYISLTCVSLGFILSLFLPPVEKSTYFHRDDEDVEGIESHGNGGDGRTVQTAGVKSSQEDSTDRNQIDQETTQRSMPSTSSQPLRDISKSSLVATKRFFVLLWADFKTCFTNKQLLQWSLWWAFATCGNLQIGNYIQTLWDAIFTKTGTGTEDQNVYNGAVEAVSTFLGALSAFLIMFPRVNWDKYGELLMGVVSIADAILLLIMGLTTNIWLCYSFYIIFRASYQLVITIATFQIAKHLTLERYALVFGWNTFVALVLETLLTLIVVDHRTLSLPPETQFLVYGGYFYLLGTAFCIKAVYQAGKLGCRQAFPACCRGNGECIELEDRASSPEGSERNVEGDSGSVDVEEVAWRDDEQLVK